MNRTTLRIVSLVSMSALLPPEAQVSGAGETRRPNIIVILADDLGYDDVGCYGGSIPTPQIDSIAANGVRFSDGYVSAATCSPSRAGLITGRYQQRFGFEFNIGGPRKHESKQGRGLPSNQQTIADVLKQAGYVTGIVGKWHLGLNEESHPLVQGFDEFFGFLFGVSIYIDPAAPGVRSIGTDKISSEQIERQYNPILRNRVQVDEERYLTNAFTEEAVAFIDRHREEPFFLYLPYNAPNTPLQATEKYLDRFAHLENEPERVYAAMVSNLDDGVGEVLAALKRNDIWEDTLVFFLSDNGCECRSSRHDESHSLRGGKLRFFEGGVRVPFVAQWPEHLPAGEVYGKPVISLDLLPTAAAAAGVSLTDELSLDGVNLLPFLLAGGEPGDPHDRLFWRSGPNMAVRSDHWKLWQAGETVSLLYDLSRDIGEKENLHRAQPEVLADLRKELASWADGLAQPLWPSPKTTSIDIDGAEVELSF